MKSGNQICFPSKRCDEIFQNDVFFKTVSRNISQNFFLTVSGIFVAKNHTVQKAFRNLSVFKTIVIKNNSAKVANKK